MKINFFKNNYIDWCVSTLSMSLSVLVSTEYLLQISTTFSTMA